MLEDITTEATGGGKWNPESMTLLQILRSYYHLTSRTPKYRPN